MKQPLSKTHCEMCKQEKQSFYFRMVDKYVCNDCWSKILLEWIMAVSVIICLFFLIL